MDYMEMKQKLDTNILDRLDLGIETVRNAAELLVDVNELSVKNKNENYQDLVSNFDLLVEKRIITDISKIYPNDGWIGEENTIDYNNSKNIWILDPIDGTTNFIYSNENFAISLAYYENEKPTFGIVYDVRNDDLYLGISGYGAFLNGEAIFVKPIEEFEKSIVYVSTKSLIEYKKKHNLNIEKFSSKVLATRSLGSIALEICKVATGKANLVLSAYVKIWDIAASSIILQESLGNLYSFNKYPYFNENSFIVCGSCKKIVKKFFELLK